jgi:hypothetical protein
MTVRFAIAHEEVGTFQTDPLERQSLAFDVTPEHEGRVAERSPRCQDWHLFKPVLNDVVKRHESYCISFGDPILVHAYHTLAVHHEVCLPGGHETGRALFHERAAIWLRRLLRTDRCS